MPRNTNGEWTPPHIFVDEYNAGQKIIYDNYVDENFADLGQSLASDSTTAAVAGALARRNAQGKLYGDITGNAAGILWNGKVYTPENMGGLPLFTPTIRMLSTPSPGYLFCTQDNGVIARGSFPQAYDELVSLKGQGDTNIRTMTEYATELAANGGICGFFALDTSAQTFRIPCMPGMYWRGVMSNLSVGQYQDDQMRPITGSIGAKGAYIFGAAGGAFALSGSSGNASTGGGVDQGYGGVEFNSSRLGNNYNGIDTHPKSIGVNYQMKLYGTVTDASEANIAALINTASGKLDASTYAADNWTRAAASAFVEGATANILGTVHNITSVTRMQTGQWQINSPAIVNEPGKSSKIIITPHANQTISRGDFKVFTMQTGYVQLLFETSVTGTLANISFHILIFND
jgi:hypothetical protein